MYLKDVDVIRCVRSLQIRGYRASQLARLNLSFWANFSQAESQDIYPPSYLHEYLVFW